MKKMVSILLLIIVTFSLSIPGYAINENFDKYDEYISYIEMGVLSEDISYTEGFHIQ